MASEHVIEPETNKDTASDTLERDRARVLKKFWPKLKAFALKLPFLEDVLAAYYCALDRNTPRHVQATLFAALAYFVLPFDFMPDLLPLIGMTDDAAMLAAALRVVSTHVLPVHYDAARDAIAKGIAKAEAETDNRTPAP